MNSKEQYIKQLVSNLPDTPGVYQYFDSRGVIIYVGKAKNLKKRVSSYFTKTHDSAKTRILVRKIADIKHIIVDTETDALLLENSLIKNHQPRYNVLLKDDKTYPWIYVKNERFARVGYTRKIEKDGSLYFGPYTSVTLVKTMLGMIKKLFPLRTCNHILSVTNIKQGKIKECLDYHIGLCKAPCIGLQSEEEYLENIEQIKQILRGHLSLVKQTLNRLMIQEAESLNFEQAQVYKEKISIIENYQSKSTVVSNTINDVDVFSAIEDEKFVYINYFKIVDGAILQSYTMEAQKALDETLQEVFIQAILYIREKFNSQSREALVPFEIDIDLGHLKFVVPKQGDKKKLLDLSYKNLKYYQRDKIKQRQNVNPERYGNQKLIQLQKDLHLKTLPIHIEGFDNSNIQGTNPVASCVVFKNGKPAKRDYRHFKIKSVEGPNDFASMEEIIYRRYKRMLDEEQSLPQLIIIDGGKGQLGAAIKSLKTLDLYGKVGIIGIAKKLEEIYFPGDSIPLYLDKNSSSLKLIQQVRNESHRFGLLFHRQLRSKNFIQSELDSIEGVGEKIKTVLLSTFGSVEALKQASLQAIKTSVGKEKLAEKIYYYFNSQKTD
ncbi:MAG: excinuclease ABC subunit C [Bacteroidales bacterium]|nr:excinuclease ABC subunit C [Bacteroidales bacterium]